MIYDTCLFYGAVWLLPSSPGVLAWKLFKNRKGKIRFVHRDLICDTKTLLALPKSQGSLDEFTTAFSPFIPLLTLNGLPWERRRKIFSHGLRKMNYEKNSSFTLPLKKGDIYWDVFEHLFKTGFKLIFGRLPTPAEFDAMYPGIVDINKLIKRQVAFPDKKSRWELYRFVVKLLAEENPQFIYAENHEFKELPEIDQVSLIVEDLLTSLCIQCSDLVCHLLLLYTSYKELFEENLENCINETLRLFPLTDLWTRKKQGEERAWIASLVQLNRSEWKDPDRFQPSRWNDTEHPPLISWGFDDRSCPASKVGYHLSKHIFLDCISDAKKAFYPASNYRHDRTFSEGCQLWVREKNPSESINWKFKGKWTAKLKQWIFSRLRILDQGELW